MEKHSIQNVLGCGLVLAALLLTSGCASSPQRIEISAKPVDKPELVLPKADVLNMREVKWVIITEQNYQQVFEDLKKTGRPIAIFGLTDKGYENLGLNLSDLRAYIQQQQTIIAAYQNYYQKSSEALDKANAEIDSVKGEVKQQQDEQAAQKPAWQFWKK